MKGSIFDIQRFSIHDGPGIRTLVFLKGCPLNCQWCSNPESQILNNEIMLIPQECIGVDKCGLCMGACGRDAIIERDNIAYINRELCIGCGDCAAKCPCDAMRNTERFMTVEEVTDYVMKDLDFYNRSKGGVTLSGGEPLYQYEFCVGLLKSFKKKRLHTAIETTAYCSWEKLEGIIPLTDLFLIDIKHMDSLVHEKYTGAGNAPILQNLKRLSNEAANVEIRIPLIPGVNDYLENLKLTAEYVKNELGLINVTLLPYHRLGQTKYDQLGKEYKVKNIQPVKVQRNKEYLDLRKQIFSDFNLNVK